MSQDVQRAIGFGELGSRVAHSIRSTYAAHIPLYVCAIVFLAATDIVANHYHVRLPFEASIAFLEIIPEFVIVTTAVFATIELVRLIRAGSPTDPAKIIGRKLFDRVMEGDRPGNIFHAVVTLTPLMIAFAALKEEIPQIHPFAWDHTFMEWDVWLGAGVTLSQRLAPYLDRPPITAALNLVYDFWFVVMFGSLFWMAFSKRNSAVRMQFLVAFALCWFIAGNVLATIFSSAGPCFYHAVVRGPDPYASQMAYLHAVSQHWPVWSVRMQELLWNSYTTGNGAVRGISAMPSMHLAIAALVACLAWQFGKVWGWAATVFTAVIAVGSVQLGWHYSVDALAGIVLAIGFWHTAGWAVRFSAKLVPGNAVPVTPAEGVA